MQQVIKFCDQCQQFRHITNFRPGIAYCTFCYRTLPRAAEGWVDPADGTMKDSEYESYMIEPILNPNRERILTALRPYWHRRPVKRRRR